MSESVVYNCDCMDYLRTLPDNAFDLAVCDPPYGDGCSQFGNVEREREREQEPDTDRARTSDNRTERGVTRRADSLQSVRKSRLTIRALQAGGAT